MNINAYIVKHAQGSNAWEKHRNGALNGSELTVAMGISSYKSRADLVAEYATGIRPEFDEITRAFFF